MITGKHLIIDFKYQKITEKTKEFLLSVDKGSSFVNECISASFMTFASPINVTHYPNNMANQESGYSISGHLQESHISIHTWPENGILTFDFFTCKDFDIDKILKLITKFFNIDDVACSGSVIIIDRSTELNTMRFQKNKFKI